MTDTLVAAVGGAGTTDTPISMIDSFWSSRKDKKKKQTQIERYIANDAPAGILKFIQLGGGPAMGVALEEFARFRFKTLATRKKGKEETGYDHLLGRIHVEQKSSGRWGDGHFHWQHVEMKHKWNMLLLCGIDYKEIHFWALSKACLATLISEGKIKNQGNSAGDSTEGVWFTYSDVKDLLTEICTDEELSAYSLTL